MFHLPKIRLFDRFYSTAKSQINHFKMQTLKSHIPPVAGQAARPVPLLREANAKPKLYNELEKPTRKKKTI